MKVGEEKSAQVISETGKLGRELHWLKKANFASQLILAAVGIIALIIYGGQLRVMRGTLDEMRRSGQTATDQVWREIGNFNWLSRSMDASLKVSE